MDSVLFMILLFPLLIPTSAKSETFSTRLSPLELGLKTEKLTHLHFYFHDTVTGPNPTAVRVAEAAVTNKSSTRFGLVMVIDDPLTVSPEVNSTVVGRAQGIYVGASQSEIAYSMVINFAFTEGKYKGSNLSLLGRNAIRSGVREMPIVGGSGVFRFARGYAQAKTYTSDLKTRNSIVEYNVYVFHY
ncbi:LOW QUALITY PROTEIN: dirigent protein 22-like [Carica papaya]|uniref:LOW QUALITY PROTEIN: dirigent protein 22-like n=1 Tax=Carica papaya TaxID=3649 RepID=UPI000B8CFDEB|nr:LOW QUALITY PROTEIN: dirigent protein 22-like [Carica papaya]